MEDIAVSEMLQMQRTLYEHCGKPHHWLTYMPENAQLHWLYMLGEAGEVIDVMKKHGQDVLLSPGDVRNHLVEELADTMMFFMDTLACLNVSPQEFASAYFAKHNSNMHRWD